MLYRFRHVKFSPMKVMLSFMVDAPCPKPGRAGTLATASRLLRRCSRGETWPVVAGLMLLLGGSLVSLLQPWPLKLVIDCVINGAPAPWWLKALSQAAGGAHHRLALLIILCAGLLIVHVLAGALTVLSTWALVAVGLRMVFRLRCELFDHMQRLSLRFHDSTSVGDALYRVTWDSYSVQAIFNGGLMPAITSLVTLVGIAAVMFTRDWIVTAIALGVAVPLILLVRRMDRPMTEHSLRVHERESEISTRVQETLSGIRAVLAFGQEAFESERFRRHAESSLRASLRLTVIQTLSQSLVTVLLAAGTALIIAIGAWRVLQGRLTAGDVVLMASYVAMLFKPIELLAYTATNVQGSVAGAHRVLAILDAQPDVADAPDALDLPGRARGAIRFENVSFGYDADRMVLRDVSFEVPAGATAALVGPSGAGKTTLVSLVLRFYDPTCGAVLLDGYDLRRLRLRSLRGNISLVLQDPVLFCASIAENIAYGRPSASRSEIEQAARAAGAHDFIMALPEGYDTRIGERGVNLSGGQKQRIAIARAFLKDAPVLVMDEPASALDAESESRLVEAVERLRAGRTTLIIAHRLSTARAADMIIVMDQGRIVETGTHEQLLAAGRLYARLYRMQFGAQPAAQEAM